MFYKVDCAYDFGQDDYIFKSELDAIDFMKVAFEQNSMSYTDAKEDGLIAYEEVEVWRGSHV